MKNHFGKTKEPSVPEVADPFYAIRTNSGNLLEENVLKRFTGFMKTSRPKGVKQELHPFCQHFKNPIETLHYYKSQ